MAGKMETIIKKNHISKRTVIFIVLAVLFVCADRLLKIMCLKGFFDMPLKLVGDIFSLHYVKNEYIAFSLPLSGPILSGIIGIIILILLLYWLKLIFRPKPQSAISNLVFPLTLVIIGAILNFSDRIKYGFVIDYFDLKYFTIFNLADCLICFGVIWLLYVSFKKNRSAVS